MNRYFLYKKFILGVLLSMYFNCFAQKNSSIKFINRISCGMYGMTHYVTARNNSTREHVKDGGKFLGSGINIGVSAEYDFSERRAIRFGILYSRNKGTPQVMEYGYPMTPFFPNPQSGYYYYLATNESNIEFPIIFKYRVLKKKHRLSPYLLAGVSLIYTLKQEYIYTNTKDYVGFIPNSQDDHIDTYRRKRLEFWRPILTVGLTYSFTNRLSIYLEPLYLKITSYSGYNQYMTGWGTFNDFGSGLGINYHF